jgi:hypothetical protein
MVRFLVRPEQLDKLVSRISSRWIRQPPPGFVVGAAISFGFDVTITAGSRPWGWRVTNFEWGAHAPFIHNAPWGRVWSNRDVQVHSYGDLYRREPTLRVEGPKLTGGSEPERHAERTGPRHPEEHHR